MPSQGPKRFEEALRNSWRLFRGRFPRGMKSYLAPRTAFEKLIKQNGVAVLAELKESREALFLLWKLSSGFPLPEEDIRKLRAQLVDLAKTIPALGIFALPGGILLLPILAKSLPWNILPSAFHRDLEKKPSAAGHAGKKPDGGGSKSDPSS